MTQEPLKPCPICGGKVDWCECGQCHQIRCKTCGLQVDNNVVGNDAETLEELREAMRKWWNGRKAMLVKHSPECLSTEHGVDVCEGMYADKCDDVLKLQDALRAVYALAGEDKQIAKIVHEVLRETGGEY